MSKQRQTTSIEKLNEAFETFSRIVYGVNQKLAPLISSLKDLDDYYGSTHLEFCKCRICIVRIEYRKLVNLPVIPDSSGKEE